MKTVSGKLLNTHVKAVGNCVSFGASVHFAARGSKIVTAAFMRPATAASACNCNGLFSRQQAGCWSGDRLIYAVSVFMSLSSYELHTYSTLGRQSQQIFYQFLSWVAAFSAMQLFPDIQIGLPKMQAVNVRQASRQFSAGVPVSPEDVIETCSWFQVAPFEFPFQHCNSE